MWNSKYGLRLLAFAVFLLLPHMALATDVSFTGAANPNCFTKGAEGTVTVEATNTLGQATDALVMAACAGAGATNKPVWIVGKTVQDATDPLRLPTVFTYIFNDQNCIRADPAGPGGTWPKNVTENVTFTFDVPQAFSQDALLIHYTAFSAEAPKDKEIRLPQCGAAPKKPRLEITKFRIEAPGPVLLGYSVRIRNIGDAPTAGDITVQDVIPSKLKIKQASLMYWDFNQKVAVTPQGQTVTADFTTSLPPAKDNPPGGPDFASARLEIWVEPKAGATGQVANAATVCGGGDETAPCSKPRESSTETSNLPQPTGPSPVASINGPATSSSGSPTTYSAASSALTSSSAAGAPSVSYAWILSDVPILPAAFGPTLSHTFIKPGQHKVNLVAFANGARSTTERTITVGSGLPGCTPGATTLCLLGGRFKVQVDWQALNNSTSGVGGSQSITSDTGAFWFFDPANLELIVKVIDGRGVNGRFWVFFGALSNVQYQLKVTDTQTAEVRQYVNPQGALTSFADTDAFPLAASSAAGDGEDESPLPEAAAVDTSWDQLRFLDRETELVSLPSPAAACIADPGTRKLCLSSRFDVSVTCSVTGTACTPHPVKLTTDTGYFWFFDSANVELMTKVVDGRGLNGKFWFFYGALSDVQYQIRITDRTNGNFKVYDNPQGRLSSVADTSALNGQ
jgi:hypothetical protein